MRWFCLKSAYRVSQQLGVTFEYQIEIITFTVYKCSSFRYLYSKITGFCACIWWFEVLLDYLESYL